MDLTLREYNSDSLLFSTLLYWKIYNKRIKIFSYNYILIHSIFQLFFIHEEVNL
jgi:hypothetical protein